MQIDKIKTIGELLKIREQIKTMEVAQPISWVPRSADEWKDYLFFRKKPKEKIINHECNEHCQPEIDHVIL